jgi:hypothetical protein
LTITLDRLQAELEVERIEDPARIVQVSRRLPTLPPLAIARGAGHPDPQEVGHPMVWGEGASTVPKKERLYPPEFRQRIVELFRPGRSAEDRTVARTRILGAARVGPRANQAAAFESPALHGEVTISTRLVELPAWLVGLIAALGEAVLGVAGEKKRLLVDARRSSRR